MRITFNPSVMNAAPVRPVRPVAARPTSVPNEDMEIPAEERPSGIDLSSQARSLARSDDRPGADERRRKPAWTMMVNLAKLGSADQRE